MIKMLNAFTAEIDDAQIAIEELKEQLDLKNSLLKNSIAFITCYHEFYDTGVLAEIIDFLPCDCIGSTTIANSIETQEGTLILCLTILTSDDCEFLAQYVDEIDLSIEGKFSKMYRDVEDKMSELPKYALTFLPVLKSRTSEDILDEFYIECPYINVFGGVSSDHDIKGFVDCFTFFNKNASRSGAAFIFISGNFEPEFSFFSVTDSSISYSKAVITKSDSHRLMEVNDMPVLDYMRQIGMLENDEDEPMHVIPFLLNTNDGLPPIARALMSFEDDGTAICAGRMPEGATIYLGRSDYNELVETAGKTVKEAISGKNKNGFIIISCAGRHLGLGADPYAETNVVKQLTKGSIPYHMTYCTGEICPIKNENDGQLHSKFNNFTFIIMAL